MKKIFSLLAISLLAVTALAHNGTKRQASDIFKLQKLTDNIYVLYGRGGNVGFIVNEDGVLVIDDQFLDIAQGIVDQIKSVTPKPIKYLINTHHHGDHTGGNGLFIKFAQVIGHHNVRKNMLIQHEDIVKNGPQQLKDMEARLTAMQAGDPQRESLRNQIRNLKNRIESAQKIRVQDVPAPTLTFDKEIHIYLAGEEIQIFHVKRGHTNGDSFIYFPKQKVLHTGDMFVNKRFPFIDLPGGASTREWIESLDAIIERVDPAVSIIPGHGEVGIIADLKTFKEYLIDLRAEVSKAIAAGKSKDEMAQSIKLEKYKNWANYPQGVIGNARIVYDEMKGANRAD